MIRRKTTCLENVDSASRRFRRKTKRKEYEPLGHKLLRKDEAERNLESFVLGGGEDVVHTLEKRNQKVQNEEKSQSVISQKEKHPAWTDEDDIRGRIEAITDKQYDGLRQGEESKIRTDQYTTRLLSRYEKISCAPEWARLPSDRGPDSEEDSDVEDLMKKTGDYTATSGHLSKGILQYKQCTDANRDSLSKGKLTAVEFHPTSQVILTAGVNQTLSLFQVDGKVNPKIQSIFLENFPIYTAHFSANGEEVIMGSKHKSFYYFDMMSGKVINVPWIKGIEETNMKKFKVSPDGRIIVFMGRYGALHLLSAQSKEWIDTKHMKGEVQALDFSRDGSRMYTHGDDGEVFIWDMNTRQCLHSFYDEGCTKGTVIAASKNDQYLACGSYSGVVNIYDKETCLKSRSPKPLKAAMNLTTPCTSAVFNSDSQLLAIASDYSERAVKLVHIPSMTVFSNFPDKMDENLRIPQCMDFSVNSGYLSVATHKGHALLYRLKHYSNY